MNRKIALYSVLAVAVTAFLIWTWWPIIFPATPAATATPTPRATVVTTAPTAKTSTATPTASDGAEADSGFNDVQPEGGVRVDDDTDPATAARIVASATAFMRAAARHNPIPATAEWWPAVAATLNEATASNAEGITPDVIPWTTISDAQLVPLTPGDSDGDLERSVDVFTDNGTWRVHVDMTTGKVARWGELS